MRLAVHPINCFDRKSIPQINIRIASEKKGEQKMSALAKAKSPSLLASRGRASLFSSSRFSSSSNNSYFRKLSSLPAQRLDDDDEEQTNRTILQAKLTATTATPRPKLLKPEIRVDPKKLILEKKGISSTIKQQQQQRFESPSDVTYTGGATMPITSTLRIIEPNHDTPLGTWPIFRLMVSSLGGCFTCGPL